LSHKNKGMEYKLS